MPSCLSRLSAVFCLCAPALLLLLTGCAMTRYEYVPPAGEAGAQCIARCPETRDSCREDELRRAEWAREHAPNSAYAKPGKRWDPLSSSEPLPF